MGNNDSQRLKAERLTAWCREVLANPAWRPVLDDPATPQNERTTFCNQAVNHVAEKFGYTAFRGILANAMIDLMDDAPDWLEVPLAQAQPAANEGRLCILGLKEEPHGHVCVVRPGSDVYSGKWQCRAPVVVNIGTENSWDKTANFIFPGGRKPQAWVYVGTEGEHHGNP